MSPDAVNAAFESGGALFTLNNCRAVLRDKAVAGVSVISTAFFFSWGLWNLYFYPHLAQPLSFAAGCAITATNAGYIALLVYYGRALRG